ncbi:menaquinone biosynthesis decarboxylase [Acidobacteria bacterium AH-259-A15]|nr:menaquinone biosynthesis decarboxylase [Acidobacteria bacterium AH-259-A15]
MSYEYDDLQDFIQRLEKERELRRIRVEVDPILEISEITDRVSKAMGPALLFENPRGSKHPLLINAFGSYRRMNLALGVESLEEVAARVEALLEIKAYEGVLDKLKMLPKLADLASFFPKTVRSGRCQEVVKTENFSLLEFPILQCWPQDAGRFITLPLVFSKNPETGKRNCGMYRMQIFDETTTAMHWQTHKHGAQHFREARRMSTGSEEERRMEVAVAIGADPAVVFSGIVPLPDDIDEMMFTGFLRRKPVEMVPCKTVELEVPASAELVLEGYVNLDELRLEGPFGDHTGFYSLADHYPVFHVTCMTHCKNPVYQTIIVGKPPQEDCYMGHAVERVFLPLIRKQLPEIIDIHMPFEGIFHNLLLVTIRKRYPGHARKIMSAFWGLGQAMFSKCIVILDEGIDLRRYGEVLWKTLNHIDPERDIQFVLGPVDSLDHSSRLPDFGSKMGIDATRKWPEEGFQRQWPDEMLMSNQVKHRIDELWPSLELEG